jgi:2-deoxy-D-gluconate 3-dehydrogenase
MMQLYRSSKSALLGSTMALAKEWAANGVRVNAIAPGGIATEGAGKPLAGSGMTTEQMEAMTAAFTKLIPLGRMGDPADIASAAVFLSAPASSYMTGALLVVDGGRLLS